MRKFKIEINLLIIIIILVSCQREKTLYSSDITGTVTEENGTPIEGATVSAGERITITDDEGVFYFKDIIQDFLAISKKGYYSQEINFNLVYGTINKLEPVILRAVPGYNQSITITPSVLRVSIFEGTASADFYCESHNTELTCREKWVKPKTLGNQLYISYEENSTTEKRTAHIILKDVETNSQDTLTLIQDEGPILQLLDYSGKDNRYTLSEEIPFIKFNRPVRIIKTEGVKISTIVYENDSTTVRFPDIQPNLLKTASYYFSASSRDGQTYSGLFTVIPPFKCQIQTKDMVFTKDNRYCWILAKENGEIQLVQLETQTYKNIRKLTIEDNESKFCYNPYNNCIYVYNKDIRIINAETGILTAILSKPSEIRGSNILSMDFCYNGFGLLQSQNKLFSILSGQNHLIEPYTENNELYQNNYLKSESIKAGNNRRQLILFNPRQIKEVFCIDADTKTCKICFNDNPTYSNYRQVCQPHKREPYIMLSGKSSENILSVNTATGEISKYNNYYNYYSIQIEPIPIEYSTPWNYFALIENETLTVIERGSGKEVRWDRVNDNTQWTNYSSDDGSILAFTNIDNAYFIKAENLLP